MEESVETTQSELVASIGGTKMAGFDDREEKKKKKKRRRRRKKWLNWWDCDWIDVFDWMNEWMGFCVCMFACVSFLGVLFGCVLRHAMDAVYFFFSFFFFLI